MKRILKCARCKLIVKYENRGKPRKYCRKCSPIVENEQKMAYYAKSADRRKAYAKKYRREHREEVRRQSREWYRKTRAEVREATEEFFDDLYENPRKYLKQVKINDKRPGNRPLTKK
jgi:chromatin segregation and condensation protein Rec8/ScpA/Scc1 (kleisin family)